MTSQEENLTGREPHRNTTSQEDNNTGRQPHRKMTLQEDNTDIQTLKKTISHEYRLTGRQIDSANLDNLTGPELGRTQSQWKNQFI